MGENDHHPDRVCSALILAVAANGRGGQDSSCESAVVNGHIIRSVEQLVDLRTGEGCVMEEGGVAACADKRLTKI